MSDDDWNSTPRAAERQPLLDKRGSRTIAHEHGNGSVRTELWHLLCSSLPVAVAYALQNSLQTFSVLVVGRLGPRELSAAAFAYMLAQCTGWCLALGGTTALDTLGSTLAYASHDKTAVGVVLQRCLIVLGLLFLPIAAFWSFIEPVLLALGQSATLASDVQAFLRVLIAGAPAYIAFESVKKYLQCQGIMHASTLVLAVISPLNVGLNYLVVHKTSLGFLGGAVATSISYWLAFALLCAYAGLSRARQCWGGFSKRALHGLWPFAKLAIPGFLMVCTEWIAFEIVAIVAGQLGDLPLSAQSVIMTSDQVINTIPFGCGVAASVRVGNLLGSRKPRQTTHAIRATFIFASLVGATIMITLLASRNVFGYLFTDDEATVRLVARVLPFVAAFQIADGWAMTGGAILRGFGRQHVGAVVNLVAYYVIALPIGISLAFKTDQGLRGLWIGQCIALFLVGIFEWVLVARSDMHVEVDLAAKRVEEDSQPVIDDL